MNKPYVKQYSESGELLNPITKENPYLISNRYQTKSKRNIKTRLKNNRKSTSKRKNSRDRNTDLIK